MREYDAVMIVTDHQAVDYGMVVRKARLVIDTRNATCGLPGNISKVFSA